MTTMGAVPERHVEIETKLDADPDFELPALDQHPSMAAAGLVSVRAAEPFPLDATYFDTDRRDLLRSRVTLRRRAGGIDEGWHLKLPAGSGARTELRLPLQAQGGDEDVPAALADLVLGATRGRPLRPVARIRTSRTTHHLLDGDGRELVEVADDVVTGTPLPATSPTADLHWREVEVELIDGTADQLAAVTDALLTAGARPAGAASKVGRVLDRSAEPSRPGVTPAGRISHYLAAQRDALILADVRLRAPDPDTEAAHDARVAAQRLRSVLSVFAPLLPSGARPVGARLRHLGATLSGLRDLDVARSRLAEVSDGWQAGPGLDELLARRRADRVSDLHRELRSEEYLLLLRDLDAFVDRDDLAGDAPVDGRAPGILVAATWLRLRGDAVTALGPLPTEEDRARALHRVRKDAKTVRYADEAIAADPDRSPIADLLRQVQDVLGAHQDAVTTALLAADLEAAGEPGEPDRALLSRWRDAESALAATAAATFVGLWPTLPLLPLPAGGQHGGG